MKRLFSAIFLVCMLVGLAWGGVATVPRLITGDDFRIAGTSTGAGYTVTTSVDSSAAIWTDTVRSDVLEILDSGYVSASVLVYLWAYSAADSSTLTFGKLHFRLYSSPVNDPTNLNAATQIDSETITTPTAGEHVTLYIAPDSLTKYASKYLWIQTIIIDSIEMSAGGTDYNVYQIQPYATMKPKVAVY